MSIKDFNKKINITDSLNGNVIAVIPKLDSNSVMVYLPLSTDEVQMLIKIRECIDNEHGCQIKVGYIS